MNERGITYRSRSSRKNGLRYEAYSAKVTSSTNVSRKAKSRKATESEGHLSSGASMFQWWGNARGWWGHSSPLSLLKTPCCIEKSDTQKGCATENKAGCLSNGEIHFACCFLVSYPEQKPYTALMTMTQALSKHILP